MNHRVNVSLTGRAGNRSAGLKLAAFFGLALAVTVALSMLFSVMAGAWWGGSAKAARQTGYEAVLAFARDHLQEGSRLQLQWYGAWGREMSGQPAHEAAGEAGTEEAAAASGEVEASALQAAGDALAKSLGLTGSGKLRQTEENPGVAVYEQNTQAGGLGIYLFIANGQVVLKLEGGSEQLQSLLAEQEQLEERLSRQPMSGRWLAGARGDLSPDLQTMEQLEAAAAKELGAKPSGRYEDERTISVTFTSERLAEQASLQDPTALQIALHRNSQTGQWHMGVGAPMLTGEF